MNDTGIHKTDTTLTPSAPKQIAEHWNKTIPSSKWKIWDSSKKGTYRNLEKPLSKRDKHRIEVANRKKGK